MGRSRQINGRALWGTESGLHRVFEGSGGDAAPFFIFIDFCESKINPRKGIGSLLVRPGSL